MGLPLGSKRQRKAAPDRVAFFAGSGDPAGRSPYLFEARRLGCRALGSSSLAEASPS
jgi:hypothetical protein